MHWSRHDEPMRRHGGARSSSSSSSSSGSGGCSSSSLFLPLFLYPHRFLGWPGPFLTSPGLGSSRRNTELGPREGEVPGGAGVEEENEGIHRGEEAGVARAAEGLGKQTCPSPPW